MKSITRDIVAYKNIEFGLIGGICVTSGDPLDMGGLIEIGRLSNVTIEINDDTRSEEIAALKKQIKQTQAECERNIQLLTGKIQSLQALENK